MIASERGEIGLPAGMALLRGGGSAMDAVEAAVRIVCEQLPQHLLLVGTGAERFADEVGIERGPTLTEEARRLWRDGLSASGLEAAEARFGPGEVRYRRTALARIAAMPALIGAGNYCDSRIGAAACTGRGELAIRGSTARSVLFRLASGDDPDQACAAALAQTLDLPDEFRTPLQALCLTPDGRHGGASTSPGATYSLVTADDECVRTQERRHL